MALDAAEFISELSIVDPPGTDPLNQGDDQIRTVKRATFQSFPLVNAAVSKTSAQMNQMAIKNEANTFTQINTFNNFSRFALGNAATPSITSNQDSVSGMYFSTSLVGFATEGVERLRLTSSQARFGTAQMYGQAGTEALPFYSFLAETSTGFYRRGAAVVGMSVLGTELWRLSSTAMTLATAQTRSVDGSAAVPAYGFTLETNIGMYRHDANTLGLAVAGNAKQLIRAASTDFVQASSTGGVSTNFVNSAGVVGYAWQYEGTSGFQPQQFSLSRFNRTTGAFIDIPLYINATTGRVHTALPVLSP